MTFGFNIFNVRIVIDRGTSPLGEGGSYTYIEGRSVSNPDSHYRKSYALRTEPVTVPRGGGGGNWAITPPPKKKRVKPPRPTLILPPKPRQTPWARLGLALAWSQAEGALMRPAGPVSGYPRTDQGPTGRIRVRGTDLGPQDESGPRRMSQVPAGWIGPLRMNQGHTGRTRAR